MKPVAMDIACSADRAFSPPATSRALAVVPSGDTVLGSADDCLLIIRASNEPSVKLYNYGGGPF